MMLSRKLLTIDDHLFRGSKTNLKAVRGGCVEDFDENLAQMREKNNQVEVLALAESRRKKEKCNSDGETDLNLMKGVSMDTSKKFANSTKEQFEKLYKVRVKSYHIFALIKA